MTVVHQTSQQFNVVCQSKDYNPWPKSPCVWVSCQSSKWKCSWLMDEQRIPYTYNYLHSVAFSKYSTVGLVQEVSTCICELWCAGFCLFSDFSQKASSLCFFQWPWWIRFWPHQCQCQISLRFLAYVVWSTNISSIRKMLIKSGAKVSSWKKKVNTQNLGFTPEPRQNIYIPEGNLRETKPNTVLLCCDTRL